MATRRIRITNDRLNSYGFRVLTSGMDVKQYERNPVLLYMHKRGEVIGCIKDIKVSDGEITGELVFDGLSELSQRCAKQYEFGSLRMVSVGIDIIEISEDPMYLLPCQTRPTVTKCKLFEVSLVDIGANDDAIVLQKDGRLITLNGGSDCPLPLISYKPNSQEMELKQLALQLGLSEDADIAAITAAITELLLLKEENVTLKREREAATLTSIETAVGLAISEKRITCENKDRFVELGKKVGLEELQAILGAMSPAVKLSGLINQGGDTTEDEKKLSELSADELTKLRSEEPETYKKLYKAEYGIECELV